MKQPILIKKSKTWTDEFSPDYLDELSDLKFEADTIHAMKEGKTYTPKPWQAYEYLDKDKLGLVIAEGFFYAKVGLNPDGTFTHQQDMTPEQLKERILREWRSHDARYPKLQTTHHRLIFSLSNEFRDKMTAAGLNPDEVLKSIVVKTMRNYSDNFHPGDPLGYCFGLHHDTDNLHAHVFVHPRTRDGERVGFSNQLARYRHNWNGQKDKLGFVKKSADVQINQWLKRAADPEAVAKFAREHLRSEEFMITPKMDVPKVKAFDHSWEMLKFQREQIAKLDKQIAEEKMAMRKSRADGMAKRLLGIRSNVWIRLTEEVFKEIKWTKVRALQAKRVEMRQFYVAGLQKRKKQLRPTGRVFFAGGDEPTETLVPSQKLKTKVYQSPSQKIKNPIVPGAIGPKFSSGPKQGIKKGINP
ncbi:MAG: hypothetical protein SFY92_00620 [Verrucomicrobiae bacterium]|nr:hypothetical protein [Verrucomicrobiae bacterium]